jgi:hypothetical protein
VDVAPDPVAALRGAAALRLAPAFFVGAADFSRGATFFVVATFFFAAAFFFAGADFFAGARFAVARAVPAPPLAAADRFTAVFLTTTASRRVSSSASLRPSMILVRPVSMSLIVHTPIGTALGDYPADHLDRH